MWAWVGCLAGRLSGERGMGAEAPAEVRGRYVCVYYREKIDFRDSTRKVHDLGVSRSASALSLFCVCFSIFVCAKKEKR